MAYYDQLLKNTQIAGADLQPGSPGTYDANGNYVPVVMATGKNAAANTTAAILRGNYENWKTQFYPKINDLMNMTTYNNPELVGQETTKAAQQVDQSFNAVEGSQARSMARYGMTQTPEATESMNRSMDLAKSAATAGAMNSTRQYLADRNRSIASGGLPAAVSGGQ